MMRGKKVLRSQLSGTRKPIFTTDLPSSLKRSGSEVFISELLSNVAAIPAVLVKRARRGSRSHAVFQFIICRSVDIETPIHPAQFGSAGNTPEVVENTHTVLSL